MPKHGKKYREAAAQLDKNRLYSPQEAIALLKKISYSAFDGTVEVHLRLGVDPRHADQMVRGTAVLPHGTGRTVRVLVFAQGDKAREAEEAGAEYVGAQDLIQRIEGGWLDFDVAVATPDMMGQVYDLGHFNLHDGEVVPQMLLPTLLEGYREVLPLPPDRERRISLMSVLIGVRALARNVRRQSPNAYQRHLASAMQRSIALLNS